MRGAVPRVVGHVEGRGPGVEGEAEGVQVCVVDGEGLEAR